MPADVHTPACWATQECTRCHRRKKPVGRSASMATYGTLCDQDCPGYYEPPTAGHFWPGEKATDEPEEDDEAR